MNTVVIIIQEGLNTEVLHVSEPRTDYMKLSLQHIFAVECFYTSFIFLLDMENIKGVQVSPL